MRLGFYGSFVVIGHWICRLVLNILPIKTEFWNLSPYCIGVARVALAFSSYKPKIQRPLNRFWKNSIID